MFRRGFAVLAAAVTLVAIFGSTANSQEALPQDDPLLVACNNAVAVAEAANFTVKWCRLGNVERFGTNNAVVTVKVKLLNQPVFLVTQRLFRTTWDMQTFNAEPVG